MTPLSRYVQALTVIALLSYASTEVMAMQRYTQNELLLTRIAWIGSEDRINQLAWEADHYGKTDYISDNKLIASLNAARKAVTTFLPNGKQISLTYDQFDTIMSDDDRTQEAYRCYNENKPWRDLAHLPCWPSIFEPENLRMLKGTLTMITLVIIEGYILNQMLN